MDIFTTLNRHSRWNGPLLNMIGKILLLLGVVLIIPTISALYYAEDPVIFIIPMMICFIVSVPLITLFRLSKNMRSTDGLFLVAVIWFILIGAGCIPYILAGFSFPDAVFEATSGFTTTGSTILTDFDIPDSLFLWRALTHWIGGIAILLIFMTLLPLLGIGGRTIAISELYGSGNKNFSARIQDTAKQFIAIYGMLTLIMTAICILLGVRPLESVTMAMSTISTGGFLMVQSMAGYSVAVQMTVMVFMFLGGTSFYLHYRAIYKREVSGYIKNTEFKTMLAWYAIISVIVFVIVSRIDTGIGFEDVVFTVLSMGTTTGFVSVNFSEWPVVALFIIMVLMFFGASAGSTAGGVKIYRGVLIMKYIRLSVQRLIHPRGVFDVKMDGISVDERSLSSAMAVTAMFMISMVIGSVVVMLHGLNAVDAFTATLSQFTNVGPAFGGEYGSFDSFAPMSPSLKFIFAIMMWAGRIEIIMAVVILSPSFWKEMLRGHAK